MTRLYSINFHENIPDSRINRCWGNSAASEFKAKNVIHAIKMFYKKHGTKYAIFNIEAYHPTIELDYFATQSLLKLEGFIK
jgi:hypothetical protein